MTTPTLERKALAPLAPVWGVTDDDEEGTFVSLVAVTGVEDNVKDIIVPGAVKASLVERLPKGIHSHDDKEWTARTIMAEEWLPGDPRLPKKTRDGKPWPRGAGAVAVKGQFNLNTPEGRRAYENVKFFKQQCEWSIGYAVVPGKSKRDRKGVRHIYELALYEYSTVLVAANPLAMTLSVKSQFGDEACVEVPVPDGVTPRDITDAVAQLIERKDGGADRNRGDAEDLRHWFTQGEGAARIGWGADGDFDRCVAIASEHMTPEQAKGYCNLRHHEATGTYPGQGHKSATSPVVNITVPEGWRVDDADFLARQILGRLEGKADPVPAQSHTYGEDGEPAAMVALMLPLDVAAQAAVNGGLAPEEMHITLAYLGKSLTPEQISAVESTVMEVTAEAAPLSGTIGGLGVFPSGEDGVPVWAPVDVPGLEVLRQRLVDELREVGAPVVLNHGYTPHVTRAYLTEDDPLPEPLPPIPVEFHDLEVVVGGLRTPFLFEGEGDQHGDEEELVDEQAEQETETKGSRAELLRAAGMPVPLSYEEVAERIRTAMQMWLRQDAPEQDQAWIHTAATYPDMAIVTAEHHDTLQAWQVPYTIAMDGTVQLGDPQPVAIGMTLPGADRTAAVTQVLEGAVAAMKSLLADTPRAEVKAGQVLSKVNSRKLLTAWAAIREVLKSAGVEPDPPADEIEDPEEFEPMPPEAPIQPDSTAPSARPSGLKALPADMVALSAAEVMEGLALVAELSAEMA
ncbi:2'-5' RNA ligase family protein [Streptosporangium sp. NPDC051022]|uniref:2'-5' RNA ligase family protein n=1 Tax=Streptosporangium sp. NPDC051022 TaxID=3155752 RepID=UPI0034232AA4